MHHLGLSFIWVLIRGEIEELVFLNGLHSLRLFPSFAFLQFPMHPPSPGEDGWYRSKTFRGWWGLAIWGHFFMSIWLWGPPCPSRRHLLSLCFFPQGQVVGSNSIAAKFHSSCANLPAFIPRALFLLTKLLYLFGERKSILFLNLFSNLNAI